MSDYKPTSYELDDIHPDLAEARDRWWQTWEEANPDGSGGSSLTFDIEQGWDSAWDCIAQAIAEHDRMVAERAWAACVDHLEAVLGGEMKRAAHADNPYRKEQA